MRSSTTTEAAATKNSMRPVRPGQVLRKELLVPLGLSVEVLAPELVVPVSRILAVIQEADGRLAILVLVVEVDPGAVCKPHLSRQTRLSAGRRAQHLGQPCGRKSQPRRGSGKEQGPTWNIQVN